MTQDINTLPPHEREAAKVKLLVDWQAALKILVDTAKPLVAAEMELRKQVFAAYFPTPKEGVNNVELAGGAKLKGEYKLERSLDEAAMGPVFEKLPPGFGDLLVRWKPGLKVTEYKALSAEHRQILDECVITKPQSPSLEIVPPKEKK